MTEQHPHPCCAGDDDSSALSRRGLLWRGAAISGGVLAGGLALPGAAHAAPTIYHPFRAYPVTGTWQDHLNRGSLGGIDFAMGVGTALPACGGGTVQNIPYNGTGGHTITIHHGGGWRTQYMHLSQFLMGNGAAVGAGAVVGRSGGAAGADGSGNSTGPHLHWHMIDPNGTRVNPLNYINSSGPGSPNPGGSSEGVILQEIGQAGGYTGPVDGVPGPNTWRGVQQVVKGYGYTGPVDGVPGPNTYAALQRLAKLGGYTGPIDGAPGPNTWRGVQQVMRGYGYTGPIDGAPGVNTYAALQRMAQKGGYTGPVDGIPGPNTWAALGRLI